MKTHLQVVKSNGAKKWEVKDGDLLKVIKETVCFYYVAQLKDGYIKMFEVSKKTGRACGWNKTTAPMFAI